MNDSGVFLTFLAAILVIGFLFILSIAWQNQRSEAIIEKWAMENKYKILSKEHAWLWAGPFFWKRSRAQTVYRLQVENESGRVSNAWALCGHWFSGLMSDEIAVEWDTSQENQRSSV